MAAPDDLAAKLALDPQDLLAALGPTFFPTFFPTLLPRFLPDARLHDPLSPNPTPELVYSVALSQDVHDR
jgi:hypothetical protein